MAVNSEAQTDSLTDCHTVLNSFHRLLEGSFFATKLIIDFTQTVEGNPDITNPDIFNLLRHLPGDQRTIG